MHLHESWSQYREWMFSKQQLWEKRHEMIQNSLQRVRDNRELENNLNPTNKSQLVNPPTLEEHLEYVSFFQGKIMDYCKYFKFSEQIEATAVVFFKRFYLQNTVWEYDPKKILMTCVYLATKVEHQPIELDAFLSKISNSPPANMMIDLEFTVSQALEFKFMVHHPYIPLHGFFLDIQRFIQNAYPSVEHSNLLQQTFQVYNKAVDLIRSSLKSDLCFLYSPNQIAFGALFQSANKPIRDLLEKYISARYELMSVEVVASLLTVIQDMTFESMTESSKTVLHNIAAKCKKWVNPALEPECLLYQKLKQDENNVEKELLDPFQ